MPADILQAEALYFLVMATGKDFFDYACDQIAEVVGITGKKMFGEYAIYKDGKMILLGPAHTTWNQRACGDDTQGKIDKCGKYQVQLVISGRYPPISL
jgi:hypothetical protein